MGVSFNLFNVRLSPETIVLCFLLSTTILIATTPVHEATHWMLSEIDPYITPTEIHIFDQLGFQQDHILYSAVGYVVVKEAYPGSFAHRPWWGDILQEIICLTIQLIITVFVVLKIFSGLMKKYPNLIILSDATVSN